MGRLLGEGWLREDVEPEGWRETGAKGKREDIKLRERNEGNISKNNT